VSSLLPCLSFWHVSSFAWRRGHRVSLDLIRRKSNTVDDAHALLDPMAHAVLASFRLQRPRLLSPPPLQLLRVPTHPPVWSCMQPCHPRELESGGRVLDCSRVLRSRNRLCRRNG
jgi:hypothetical protein